MAMRAYIRGAWVWKAAPVQFCAGPAASPQEQRLGYLLPEPIQLATLGTLAKCDAILG